MILSGSCVLQTRVEVEEIMRACIISLTMGAFIGVAALPAVACELHQAEQASDRTVTAFLPEHSPAAQSVQDRQLAACGAEGGPCTTDNDCCSGACKPIVEGRACASK
jgi:hypothetical protein